MKRDNVFCKWGKNCATLVNHYKSTARSKGVDQSSTNRCTIGTNFSKDSIYASKIFPFSFMHIEVSFRTVVQLRVQSPHASDNQPSFSPPFGNPLPNSCPFKPPRPHEGHFRPPRGTLLTPKRARLRQTCDQSSSSHAGVAKVQSRTCGQSETSQDSGSHV